MNFQHDIQFSFQFSLREYHRNRFEAFTIIGLIVSYLRCFVKHIVNELDMLTPTGIHNKGS